MKIDAYSILIILSVLVVLSYSFNYLSRITNIPSVLLLIGSGIGLKEASIYYDLPLPATGTLLELLGVAGLIFIVLEASLDLKIERGKLLLIGRAFVSAIVLLAMTSLLIAFLFAEFYEVNFLRALIHAIPLSVISSAIAIPSVTNMDEDKKEFVIYESTFSDILGIIAFNYLITEHASGFEAVLSFGWEFLLIMVISIISTVALVFLLNHSTSKVRFFLTFAIIVLVYSISKFLHLPSLILVLGFGLVISNFNFFDFPIVHRFVSFPKIAEVSKELKTVTVETAFIIRTFFFLVFGYSINLMLLKSEEVIFLGIAVILITFLLRFVFLKYLIKVDSAPLSLIAPRGLITILLFYSIPPNQRLVQLSEGVLFIVIVSTSLLMVVGLLITRKRVTEKVEELI